jgi:hypothetical protein
MRILMILIPDAESPPSADPVLRFERFAVPYYLFVDAGIEVVLASPSGGSPLLAPVVAPSEPVAAIVRRFRADVGARDAANDTLSLDQVASEDFESAFCIGVPGPIWRDPEASSAATLIGRFLTAGKPVGIIPSQIDATPRGSDDGLLIVGEGQRAPLEVAKALIAAMTP